MVLELDIQASENQDETELRNFYYRREPIWLAAARYYPEDVEEKPAAAPGQLVDIVGWEDGQAVPARAVITEDSGDGEAVLIYGGNQGLRLRARPNDSNPGPYPGNRTEWEKFLSAFSLANSDEWGEAYLYYARDLFETAVAPFEIVNSRLPAGLPRAKDF